MNKLLKKLPDLSSVMSRFPIPTAIMAVFTLILVILDPRLTDDYFGRLLLGLIIAGYVCFCITIVGESREGKRYYLIQIISTLVICIAAWFSCYLRLNLIMALGAILLLLGNIVLWRKTRNDLHVWDFTHKVWTGAVFATVGSIIFLVGVLSIQFALKSLFGVRINRLIEDLIIPIAFGFLAPLYWLSTTPKPTDPYEELIDNPSFVSKAVAFFGTWLLSPLTLIYAVILLAYSVKIIMMRELPKGEIAGLTTPFLIIGALTWLVLQPTFIKEKFLAKLFIKSWFYLSIPAALLLTVSVFVRIENYGLTQERFALVLAVIWALGIGLWFCFAPEKKRDIRYIPGFASILFFIGTFTADFLSVQSQSNRLVSNLERSGLVSEMNEITPGIITDKKAAQNVKGTLNFLLQTDEEKRIDRILSRYGYEGSVERQMLFKNLGIEDLQMPSRYSNNIERRAFSNEDTLIDVRPYSYISGIHSLYFSEGGKSNIAAFSGYSLKMNNRTLELYEGTTLHKTFDVNDWVGSLETAPLNKELFKVPERTISLFENEATKIDLNIRSVSETIYESGDENLYITFFIMVADKPKANP